MKTKTILIIVCIIITAISCKFDNHYKPHNLYQVDYAYEIIVLFNSGAKDTITCSFSGIEADTTRYCRPFIALERGYTYGVGYSKDSHSVLKIGEEIIASNVSSFKVINIKKKVNP